jgi:hypothetical protein
MANTTDRTTREVTYDPVCLPDVIKPFICPRRRLVRVVMLSQSAEDKLALNGLHMCLEKG